MKKDIKKELCYKVNVDENLRDALAEMIEYGTEAMSVVENGKIKGTLWLNDIVNIFQKG